MHELLVLLTDRIKILFCFFKLYCCNDYQEFVEGLIEYRIEKEKLDEKSQSSSQSKTKKKSANAHRLAQERANYRKMQLLMEKKKRMERLAHRKLQEQQELAAKRNQPLQAAKTHATPSLDESTRDYREQSKNSQQK